MWIQYTCVQYIENRTTPACGVSRTSQLWIIGLNVFFLRKLTQQGLGLRKKFGFIGCLLMESWLCIDWSRNFFYQRKIWCKEFYTVIMETLLNGNSLLQCLMWFQTNKVQKSFDAIYIFRITTVVAKHGTPSFM